MRFCMRSLQHTVPAVIPLLPAIDPIRYADSACFFFLLQASWSDPDQQPLPTFVEAALSRLFLQPYAEYLADHTQQTPPTQLQSVCPLCGGKPQSDTWRWSYEPAKPGSAWIITSNSNHRQLPAEHVACSAGGKRFRGVSCGK
jgi:hypothetical protein